MIRISRMIEELEKILKEHGDLFCVYASDDEGNYFGEVYHDPSVMMYCEEDANCVTIEEKEELIAGGDDWYNDYSEKVVCIN